MTPVFYDPLQLSLENARILDATRNFYQVFKKRVKLYLFGYCLALPFVFIGSFFFGLWVSRQRKFFQKMMAKERFNLHTYNEYLAYKEVGQQLNSFTPTLKRLSQANIKKAPFFLRFPLRRMARMSSTLLTFKQWHDMQLVKFNTPQFKQQGSFFLMVTEKELWEKRTKAYDYWL